MPEEALKNHLVQEADRYTRQLADLLAIPSVSTDPAMAPEVRRAAGHVRDSLAELGFTAELRETPGHPVVYAHRHVHDDLPTVLVYGHYDVQPAEPLSLWSTAPFEPVIRDDIIHARGASDDKGQFHSHIKAADALLAVNGELPVNLKFLIEGEEEIGSPSLDAYVREHAAELAADAVLVSDGAMVGPGVPTLTYGLRGMAYVEVRVKTASRDLHSGAYGGAVPNAINVLARMIAALHDEDGRVTVPGFYDRVRELDEAAAEALARVPFDGDRFLSQVGVSHGTGEAGRSVLERIWTRPTLDVNGIGGGFQGDGSKTVIANTAMAKISCRLVPDQSSADILERLSDHLKTLAPEGTEVEVIPLNGGEPAITSLDSAAIRTAASALETVWGRPAVYARTGGSIPVVNTFQELLNAPVVLLDMGLETDNLHAPDEHFSLENYRNGIHASALFMLRFGQAG